MGTLMMDQPFWMQRINLARTSFPTFLYFLVDLRSETYCGSTWLQMRVMGAGWGEWGRRGVAMARMVMLIILYNIIS